MQTERFSNACLGDRLEVHLKQLAQTYYELCARMSSHGNHLCELRMDGDIGFPCIEQWTHLMSHDALHQHGQIVGEVDRFPACLPLPFFVETIDVERMQLGKEPLFKVKLTHYADAYCSLSFTIANVLADFPRFYNVVNDLGRLMRQETEVLGPIDHDRSRLWPDRFLSSLHLNEDFPADCNLRKFPSSYNIFKYDAHQFPGEEITLEMLYFPEVQYLTCIPHTFWQYGMWDVGNDYEDS